VAPPPIPVGQIDLRTLLEPLAGERITVSCPADAVSLPYATAGSGGGDRRSARQCAPPRGPGRSGLGQLEDEGEAVTVGVRDDGNGFAASRLAQAADAGRSGVAQLIAGRIREVGGEAEVVETLSFRRA
jgi:hypothetical protein